jgi:diguanylate cyclase (GGDEF)-like protein
MIADFRDLPLKTKLNIALLMSSGIAASILFIFMLMNTVYHLRQELVSQISTLTEVTAANSAAALVFNDTKSAENTLAALHVKPEIIFAEIRDSKNQRFAIFQRSQNAADYAEDFDRDRFWDPILSISRFVILDNGSIGHVRIVADLSRQISIISEQILALTIATIISLISTLLIANRFRNMIASPIEQVASTAKAIAQDQNFSRRVPQAGSDEVGQLVDAFNQMVEQIEDREKRLQGELQHRILAEHEFEKLAHYDTLTGLPNRFMFHQALGLTMKRAKNLGNKVALFFIDLDNFKVINDSLGHATGDMLLKILSQRMVKCVRGSDIVCRLGGDEFTIIIDHVKGLEYITDIANKLAVSFAETVKLKEFEFQSTASIGIALFPDDATAADDLLRNADTAMYFAKSHGRSNFQFFSSAMNERANRRLVIESHLRHAIEKNELFLVYQPQVDFTTGRIVSAEALLRWASPELGNVSPVEFIPVAEETGLIQKIGEFVMETACLQTRRWLDEEGISLRVAVNVSIRQFGARQFIDNIQALLTRTGLPVKLLELELTESCIMDNVDDTLRKIRKLHELGIRLSIDDFGTGYSSMSYLKQLPISQLKIDQSFVRDIPENREDVAIVRAVLQLSHGLKLESLAEGVETVEQVRFLAQEGCMIAQGYYFSRPVPVDEFSALLRGSQEYSW